MESRWPGLVPGRSGAREAGDSSHNYQNQTWNRRQRPQLTSAGRGAPRGCWAAAPRRGPRRPEHPAAFSAARLPKPAQPRIKTTLSGTKNSGKNTPVDKARPFSGPESCFPPLGHRDPTTPAESAVKRERKTRLWEEEGVKSRASCFSCSFHFTATTCCHWASCWLSQGYP